MSVYSQVSAYSDYVDLQHYTGSLATRPQMSGAIWLSGSGVNDTQFHFNSKMETPGLTLDDTTSVTSILDQDTMSSNSATALATQQSIKAYVDSQVTSADLDFAADSGSGDVDLTTQTFQVSGTNNEIDTSASNQTLTIGLPSSVTITNALQAGTTLSSSGQTSAGSLVARTLNIDSMAGNWTNASRTVADLGTVTTVDLNGGTIDATTIGASSQTSGKFTTVSGSGAASFRGTLTAVEAASSFAGVTCTTVSGSGAVSGGTLTSRQVTISGANAQSITSTGANNITLTSGKSLVFDAQGSTEDDGFMFSLGTDTGDTVFGVTNNGGSFLFGIDGAGSVVINPDATLASKFTMYGNDQLDDDDPDQYMEYTSATNALIVYNGAGGETMRFGGDASSDYALDVKDGSNAENKVRAAAFVTYSDERLKTDVNEMQGALKTVNSLKAVNFTWKKDGSRDFGFLAQDLKKVIPQAVHGNEDGLMGVDYGRLTSVLVGAIQEQSAQIKALQERLDK